MDKKVLILAGTAVAVMVLILEPFFFGGASLGGGALNTAKNMTGTAVFNGTIRTYDPVLFLSADTNQSVIGALRAREGVSDVALGQDGYTVYTETRDDVYPVAAWLRASNVSALAIANVISTGEIPVETINGTVNASVPGGVIRVITEPLLEADSDVAVSMVAVISGSRVLDYGSAQLLIQELSIRVNATVASLGHKTFRYTVPWDERNSVEGLDSYDYEYKRVDSIVFDAPLDVGQVMAKKQLSYVTYIDSSSAQVQPSFDNATLVAGDFADAQYRLPPSTLTITANDTPELGITAVPAVSYYYLFEPEWEYEYGEPLELESAGELEINETVELDISALALGDTILTIRRAALPS